MPSYVGRRNAGTASGQEHLGSNPSVVRIDGRAEHPLEAATEPDNYPITVTGDFEWGYGGVRPD
jgi:hypothetical protein